ncbi:MAG: transporter [Terriglobales bacterium]
MGKTSALLLLAVLLVVPQARAQDWVSNWFEMVGRTSAEQPQWATPLVTSSARLDQRFRYDIVHSQTVSGDVWNFGNSKGLDLIVAPRLEVILAVPPYMSHENPASRDGFGDASFQLKYRIRARNEERGNYVVTAFLNATVPTGTYRNGTVAPVLTPTIAAGKGWGLVVWQSTAAVGIPVGESVRLGYPLQLNTALQYHVQRFLWPQVEANSTLFYGGAFDGKKQVFLTPGLVCGRFPLSRRLRLTFGSGVQIAATRFHTSNHNVMTTLRTSF